MTDKSTGRQKQRGEAQRRHLVSSRGSELALHPPGVLTWKWGSSVPFRLLLPAASVAVIFLPYEMYGLDHISKAPSSSDRQHVHEND